MGGLGAGALVTAILVVNNVRDIESDRLSGRKNIPVVWGRRAGELEYLFMFLLAYIVPAITLAAGWANGWIMLPYISSLMAVKLYREMRSLPSGPGFNKLLAKTAQLVLVYCVCFSVGIILSGNI